MFSSYVRLSEGNHHAVDRDTELVFRELFKGYRWNLALTYDIPNNSGKLKCYPAVVVIQHGKLENHPFISRNFPLKPLYNGIYIPASHV